MSSLCRLIRKSFKKHRFQSLISSCLAGTINVLVTNPLSVIANFVIGQKKINNKDLSMIQAVRDIVKQKGLAGLYTGLGISLILVINPVIIFTFQQWYKRTFRSSLTRLR